MVQGFGCFRFGFINGSGSVFKGFFLQGFGASGGVSLERS